MTIAVGVIGVGSMGAHHARVYSELPSAHLCGVADADTDRAEQIAHQYGTRVQPPGELIASADAVSVAVPTHAHAEIAKQCIEAGTDLLIEKPFVLDQAVGEDIAAKANAHNVILQIGHIERFNPAVRTLFDLVDTDEVVALRTDRLGPPVGRSVTDDVVMDLMIHDIDILLHLMGKQPRTVTGATRNGTYASVLAEFDSDVIATLTASRVTQRKVRHLEVTTPDRHFEVDYLDQSLRIHRRSRPSYQEDDADMRYRHESIIEQPLIESAEPLKLELEAFLTAVRDRTPPAVTAGEALDALSVAWSIKGRFDEPTVEAAQL